MRHAGHLTQLLGGIAIALGAALPVAAMPIGTNYTVVLFADVWDGADVGTIRSENYQGSVPFEGTLVNDSLPFAPSSFDAPDFGTPPAEPLKTGLGLFVTDELVAGPGTMQTVKINVDADMDVLTHTEVLFQNAFFDPNSVFFELHELLLDAPLTTLDSSTIALAISFAGGLVPVDIDDLIFNNLLLTGGDGSLGNGLFLSFELDPLLFSNNFGLGAGLEFATDLHLELIVPTRVSEPAVLALLVGGLAGVFCLRRRAGRA